jgi:hypothetical protein
MNIKNILLKSFVISNIIIIFSFNFPIIPCVEFPNVPNPIRSWEWTHLGYKMMNQNNSILEYFGFTESVRIAYFVVLIITFFISLFVLLIINKKIKKRK